MLKLVIDTLTLRDLVTPTVVPYVVQEAPGLEAPDYRVGSYEKPGEDGARVTSALYGARPFSISGEINALDAASHQLARQSLASAFRIQRDSFNYPKLTHITFTALDGGQYFLDAQVKSFKNPLGLPTTSNFIATLTAPDPAIYGATIQTTGQITVQTGGGVAFPLVFPLIFTAGTGGVGLLNNTGNMATWPIIYLRGALTNPRVYCVETGGLVQLAYTTLNTSDVIVIDMANHTVMLNGSINLLPYVSTDSKWFSVAPGLNTYRFTTSSAGDPGTMEVTAYPAYIGV